MRLQTSDCISLIRHLSLHNGDLSPARGVLGGRAEGLARSRRVVGACSLAVRPASWLLPSVGVGRSLGIHPEVLQFQRQVSETGGPDTSIES